MGIPLSNTPLMLPSGYLSTYGNQFIDVSGNFVKIAAIDWDGAEYGGGVAYPLWHSRYTNILDGIKAAGFNCIRYNFSDITLSQSTTDATNVSGDTDVGTVNTRLNPELAGNLSFFQATDVIVNYCTSIGLKIYFAKMGNINNNNITSSGLWYGDGGVTNQQCTNNLVAIANRYKNNPTIIGLELNNEVHAPTCTFNDGTATDIIKFWTNTGNAIHAVNPDILIICQGPQSGDGGDYSQDGGCVLGRFNPTLPVLNTPNKCVISTHIYPNVVSGGVNYTASNLQRTFGYIFSNGSYPILISEMGYPNDYSADTHGSNKDKAGCDDWRNTIFAFIESGIQNIPTGGFGPSWTWFCANPSNATDGFGSGLDTGFGLLRWSDSKTPIEPPYSLLRPHLNYGGGGGVDVGPVKTLTINPITQVQSNQNFAISGSAIGYTTTISPQYSDGLNIWNDFAPNSILTPTSFNFVHPGMAANSSAVVSVRDKNDTSIQANSAPFAVVDPVINRTISVQVGGPFPEATAFNVEGELGDYDYAPLLQYQDNNGTWINFPTGSVITSTSFVFSHPGMNPNNTNTIKVRDSDLNSIIGTSSSFQITRVLQESPQGASLTQPSSDPILDEDFTEYNLVSSSSFGLQVSVDAGVDNTTANVALLLYWNHIIYYQNTAGNFFTKLNSSNVWRQTTDPRVAIPKSCTVVIPNPITANVPFNVTGDLIGYTITPTFQYQDNLGLWTSFPTDAVITNSNFTFLHPGMQIGNGIKVSVRDKNIPTISATSSLSQILNANESLEGSTIQAPNSQTIIDSLGNYWGISSDNKITFNGSVDNTTSQVLLLYYSNRVIYYQGVSQSWFKKPNIYQQWLLTTSPYLSSPSGDTAKIKAASQSLDVLISSLEAVLKRIRPTMPID